MSRVAYLGIALLGTLAQAQAQAQVPVELTVIEGTGPSIASAPYLKKITDVVAKKERALKRAQDRVVDSHPPRPHKPVSSADFFPLSAAPLQLAGPQEVIRAGLLQPLFVIGADAASLTWLEAALPRLVAVRARGVVVAGTHSQFTRLRSRLAHHGIGLSFASGASIASGYSIVSYPMLIQAGRS